MRTIWSGASAALAGSGAGASTAVGLPRSTAGPGARVSSEQHQTSLGSQHGTSIAGCQLQTLSVSSTAPCTMPLAQSHRCNHRCLQVQLARSRCFWLPCTACHLAAPSCDQGAVGCAEPRAGAPVEAGCKMPLAAVMAALWLMAQVLAGGVRGDPRPAPGPLGNPATASGLRACVRRGAAADQMHLRMASTQLIPLLTGRLCTKTSPERQVGLRWAAGPMHRTGRVGGSRHA